MSLLKDPVFLLIGISNVFGMAGLYVPFVYLVDAAVLDVCYLSIFSISLNYAISWFNEYYSFFKGIESNSASFLLSIIGITNTIGRVACGYVADFPQVDSLLLNNICLIISTIAVAATPFCHSYAAYIIMSIFFGIAICKYLNYATIKHPLFQLKLSSMKIYLILNIFIILWFGF